jgi:hypothetical protein
MLRRLPYIMSGVAALLLLNPRPSLAIPIHGNPQGFFVHQAAHLLITWAMVFFIYTLKREGLLQFRGFRLLAWASGIFGFWSLEHFLGHFSEIYLTNPVIMGRGLSERLLMESFNTWVYYFTHLDNWILVISFYLLYRGLKVLSQEAQTGRR